MITPSITDMEDWFAEFLSAATGLAVGDTIRLGFPDYNTPAYSGNPILSYAIYPAFGEWGDKDFEFDQQSNKLSSFMTRRLNCLIATVGLSIDVLESIRGSLTGYQREKLTSRGIYPLSHCEPPDREPIFYNGKWIDAYYLSIYFNVMSKFTEEVDIYNQFTIDTTAVDPGGDAHSSSTHEGEDPEPPEPDPDGSGDDGDDGDPTTNPVVVNDEPDSEENING